MQEAFARQDYCAYRHLSEMLDRTGTDWLIGMYEAYFDDSGTDSSCPIAIAACYVSRKRSWDEFVEQWDCARREEDFDFFHMADFAANPKLGKKPFCEWDSEKRKRVYYRLAHIINENKQIGFGIAIPKEVFDKVVPTLPEQLQTKCGKYHYTFAVKVLMTLIGQWRISSEIKLPMRYVFDRMGKGRGEIKAIWDGLEGFDAFGKLGMEPDGYSFENKEFFKPLQAADILAWQMNWHMRNVVSVGKRDPQDAHRNFIILRIDQAMDLKFMTEANFLETIKWELERLEAKTTSSISECVHDNIGS